MKAHIVGQPTPKQPNGKMSNKKLTIKEKIKILNELKGTIPADIEDSTIITTSEEEPIIVEPIIAESVDIENATITNTSEEELIIVEPINWEGPIHLYVNEEEPIIEPEIKIDSYLKGKLAQNSEIV